VSEDVKPDPVFDKLGRFTLDGSGIDRDEWLFQAGRASARTPWGWKAAVGVLLLTQTATMTVWLSASAPVSAPPMAPAPTPEAPAAPVRVPDDVYRLDPDSYVVLLRTFDPSAPPPLPPHDPLSEPAVPLTAGWRGTIE
jgi:hypothetical protein